MLFWGILTMPNVNRKMSGETIPCILCILSPRHFRIYITFCIGQVKKRAYAWNRHHCKILVSDHGKIKALSESIWILPRIPLRLRINSALMHSIGYAWVYDEMVTHRVSHMSFQGTPRQWRGPVALLLISSQVTAGFALLSKAMKCVTGNVNLLFCRGTHDKHGPTSSCFPTGLRYFD